MSGKWERGECFMWVKSFFSGNIQQAHHPRMELYGPPKTTQASGMIPALIPEKVMLLTWNWTALVMSQQILDPFFAVLGNGPKNCPNLKHWQIVKNEKKGGAWGQSFSLSTSNQNNKEILISKKNIFGVSGYLSLPTAHIIWEYANYVLTYFLVGLLCWAIVQKISAVCLF